MTTFTVPGYAVEAPLGRGGFGEVWRGIDLATGRAVALKRLPGAGPEALTRLRAEVAAAAGLAGEHVVAVLDVRVDEDEAVLVTALAGGGSLEALLRCRPPLTAGEAVTVLGPLAEVLAVAHARLLVHGDISPGNVLFSGEGRPMLGDWGQARVFPDPDGRWAVCPAYADRRVLAGEPPDAAADVAALAAVGYAALTGDSPLSGGGWRSLRRVAPLMPGPLIEAIDAALSPRLAERPGAAEFARAVFAAADPVPVRLPRPQPTGGSGAVTVPVSDSPAADSLPGVTAAPDASPARRIRRVVVGAAVTVVALAGAVGSGMWWGRSGPQGARLPPVPFAAPVPETSAAPRPAASATAPVRQHAAPASWRSRVQALADLRVQALQERRLSLLLGVYCPGSRALARDRHTVRRLAAAGLAERGLAIRIRRVRVSRAAPGGERWLQVAQTRSAYRVVAQGTTRVVAVAPAARQTLMVRVCPGPAGWAIAAVRRV